MAAADEPPCLYWNCEQVADWIESLGLPQYRECFTTNLVDGRKLILADGSHLPQLGITDFEHIKFISGSVRELLGIEDPKWNRTIAIPHREPMGMFLERKSITGQRANELTFEKYQKEVRRNEIEKEKNVKKVTYVKCKGDLVY
ncbi:putative sterile alpha motif domain-containing protein 15-like [Apostichopus japonicus]|uniref:Putative sterile alpha motif domain-containing protein 15-like n=1 Tax=Stichopus japonicus TaxID=307972 RepID=A0A2G8JJC1_STIJA|nr:putative sterile alpha motif domain-containing protein 15-like [Apostichopus japonicus]